MGSEQAKRKKKSKNRNNHSIVLYRTEQNRTGHKKGIVRVGWNKAIRLWFGVSYTDPSILGLMVVS